MVFVSSILLYLSWYHFVIKKAQYSKGLTVPESANQISRLETGISFIWKLRMIKFSIYNKEFKIQPSGHDESFLNSPLLIIYCTFIIQFSGKMSGCAFSNTGRSKVIIHKSHGEQFLWNRNLDLGWIWAGWQYWKRKSGPIMSNILGPFFMFTWAKEFEIFENIVASALKSCIRWSFFFFLKKQRINFL